MHRKYVCNLLRADADLSHEQELKGIVVNIFSSVKIFGRVVGQHSFKVLLSVSGQSSSSTILGLGRSE